MLIGRALAAEFWLGEFWVESSDVLGD